MELFRLFGTIAIKNATANSAIDETTDKAEDAEGKMSGSFGKIGKAAVAMAAAVGTAAVAATGALTKAAVEGFAEYEQLVGGVDTLFKTSSQKVQEYANKAYTTAGLSANAYMETVTSFSASLLQGLGGNTEKAAEMADMAIVDMSDNANKMGTSMDLIQNAYQGFAKSNYTMLDNLKLGYGGTQEEMVRLINDSGVLNEKITSMDGIKFDTVVEAIHAVQTNIGITGTTAREASTTIQGSIGQMKGAWENLLVGIAAGDQDTSMLFKNLYDSGMTVAENLLPRIGITLKGIGTLIATEAPVLGKQLVDWLSDTVVKNLPTFADKGLDLLMNFSGKIRENASKMVSTGLDLLVKLVKGIMDSLPSLIAKAPVIVSNFAGVINDNAPKVIAAGVKIIGSIVKGLIKAIPTLVKNIPQIIKAVVDVWTAFNWVNIGKNVVKSIGDGFKKMKDFVKTKAKDIKDDIMKIFDFKITLPKIKLPHFSVTPAGWKLGDLLKGETPTLGIKWFAKAMDNPMIMTRPTIFGYNPSTGDLMGGGEAGSEVVSGTNTLMGMISEAVAKSNGGMIDVLYKILAAILSMDGNMGENLKNALDGTGISVGRREFGRLVREVM